MIRNSDLENWSHLHKFREINKIIYNWLSPLWCKSRDSILFYLDMEFLPKTIYSSLVFKPGLEIRHVLAKLRFWVCRTLEFFAWVFEKNQGFLKKSYVNWSRILSLVNRFWIFIGISNDSFLKITLRSFLPIFSFFVWNFVESLSSTRVVSPWAFLCRISKPVLNKTPYKLGNERLKECRFQKRYKVCVSLIRSFHLLSEMAVPRDWT